MAHSMGNTPKNLLVGRVILYTIDNQIFDLKNTKKMNEIFEGRAHELGGNVWAFYIHLTNRGYKKLVAEVRTDLLSRPEYKKAWLDFHK